MLNVHINEQVKKQAEALLNSNFEGAPSLKFERFDEDDANGVEISKSGQVKVHDIRGHNEFAGDSEGSIEIRLYCLDDLNIFVVDDECGEDCIYFETKDKTIEQLILSNYSNDDLDDFENLASFGLDVTPPEVDEGENLRVWKTVHLLRGANQGDCLNNLSGYVTTDGTYAHIRFADALAAAQWISSEVNKQYTLKSEHARHPTYTICK